MYLQAVEATTKTDNNMLTTPKINSFQHRVLRAICRLPGPALDIRTIQRSVSNARADTIRGNNQYHLLNGCNHGNVIIQIHI